MKQLLIVIFFIWIIAFPGIAQVSITNDGTAPAPSAMLELKSTNKGLLLPRMTTIQRDAIVSPVASLMIFNTDENQVNVFSSGSWKSASPVSCGQPFTDTRDGKSYKTVQIGTQCWMAQNLNIGTKILGNADQTNNNIIDKYCYGDDDANCNIYGGLYQWNEAMQYLTTEGV